VKPVFVALMAALVTWPAMATDLSGLWVAHARPDQVLKIERTPRGYRGIFYILGRDAGGTPATITIKGNEVDFSLDNKYGQFHGAVKDRQSFSGIGHGGGPGERLTFIRTHAAENAVVDPSPHKVRFIPVAKNVNLEVLDWGGNGPPLVFLSGWGNTAHVFDTFAPKFTAHHHVYGITRRGFGASSTPLPTLENFDPDRLADDVVAVIDALKLDSPILVGHSVAGQEMSSIGVRYPAEVSGLIYLDAAFSNAFYNPDGGYTAQVEADNMRRLLEKLPKGESESPEQLKEVLRNIPLLQRSLEQDLATVEGAVEKPLSHSATYQEQVADVMARTRRKYVGVKSPFLAIIAAPYKCNPDCSVPTERAWAGEVMAQANAVKVDYPKARVVLLPEADHYIFRSNEADVELEMNAFMNGLPH